MKEELIQYLTGLFKVLERTRLKLYECDFIDCTLTYNNRPITVRLDDNKLVVRLKYDIAEFEFVRNEDNARVLSGLVKRLEVQMMFYKTKDGNIFNLNEIVAISTLDGFREGYYTIMFKAAPSFAIDKEDYENIIKYLEIVNEGDKQ